MLSIFFSTIFLLIIHKTDNSITMTTHKTILIFVSCVQVQDVNELSRHEVDDIIKAYSRVDQTDEIEGIRKR